MFKLTVLSFLISKLANKPGLLNLKSNLINGLNASVIVAPAMVYFGLKLADC